MQHQNGFTTVQVRSLVHQALNEIEEFLGGAKMIDQMFDDWLAGVCEAHAEDLYDAGFVSGYDSGFYEAQREKEEVTT